MSLLFIDGFDHYPQLATKWDIRPTGVSPSPEIYQGGRFGGGYLEIQDNSIHEIVKFVETSNELIIGVALRFFGVHAWLIRLQDDAGTTIVTHECSGTGGEVFRGTQLGTSIGTYASAFTTNTWQYLEFRCLRDAVNGEIEVRVNGVQVLASVGLNTGATDFSRVFLRATAQNSNDCNLDDLYILNTAGATNNNFLGDVRVTALRPKEDGLTNDFTPSDLVGPNYTMVDDAQHNGDVDYVESGQLGAKENYDNSTFEDVGFAAGAVFGVQVVTAARKTDAGGLKYKDKMLIGGLEYDNGMDVTANSVDYKMSTFIRDTDPSDDAPWTEEKVAATGSGFEITFKEI